MKNRNMISDKKTFKAPRILKKKNWVTANNTFDF